MRTDLQRQTARLNGAKSRGPITAAGKLRSSKNACRHGLYSRQVFTPPASESLNEPPPTPSPNSSFAGAEHHAWLDCLRAAELESQFLSEEITRQRVLDPAASRPILLARAHKRLCETGVMQALHRLNSAALRNWETAAHQLNFGETNPAISLKEQLVAPPAPGPADQKENCAKRTRPLPSSFHPSVAPLPQPHGFGRIPAFSPARIIKNPPAHRTSRCSRSHQSASFGAAPPRPQSHAPSAQTFLTVPFVTAYFSERS